jgi:DNA-directed RNA polymerase specialized sigma24 family protein
MLMSDVSRVMKSRVADPALRREVEAAVRRRVRGDDAEDVVQATLADVLSAQSVPDEPEEFRRFVFGVARNKVFDHFRRQKRQVSGLDDHEPAAPEPPLSARDILRWAEGELPDPDAKDTLEWMLREGDGEKLEHIARDAKLPAARVRKRVSRLRKFFRERWAAELMLASLLGLLCALGTWYWFSKGRSPKDFVEREPVRPPPSAPPQVPPSRPAGETPNDVLRPPSKDAVPSPTSEQSSDVPQSEKSSPQRPLHRTTPLSTESSVKPLPKVQSKAAPAPVERSAPPTKGLEALDLSDRKLDDETLNLPPAKQRGGEKKK